MEKEKLEILERSFGRFFSTGEECLFQCPKCEHHKRKLSVNIEKNVFKCWICGYSGIDISSLVKRYAPYSEYSKWLSYGEPIDLTRFEDIFATESTREEKPVVNLPESFKTLTGKVASYGARHAISYLKHRGIDKEDILNWKIGYCDTGDYAKRVCVPSFGENGDLNYFIARSYANQFPKYKNPPVSRDVIFNDLYIDWDEPIVLVEGIFDAIKAVNAIPILGSSLGENSKLFKKIVKCRKEVYIALDSDAESKERKIIRNLMDYDIEVRKINLGLYSDIGDMTRQVFLKHQKEATVVDHTDYLYQYLNF